MLYDTRYDWKKGLVSIIPGAERIFKVGDRVKTHYKPKQKDISGTVLKIEENHFRKKIIHPEIYIKTDELVDEKEGALLGGFGLRWESSVFRFEDETEEEKKLYEIYLTTDIPAQEMKEFQKLKPSQRRKLIKSGTSLNSLNFL